MGEKGGGVLLLGEDFMLEQAITVGRNKIQRRRRLKGKRRVGEEKREKNRVIEMRQAAFMASWSSSGQKKPS